PCPLLASKVGPGNVDPKLQNAVGGRSRWMRAVIARMTAWYDGVLGTGALRTPVGLAVGGIGSGSTNFAGVSARPDPGARPRAILCGCCADRPPGSLRAMAAAAALLRCRNRRLVTGTALRGIEVREKVAGVPAAARLQGHRAAVAGACRST